MSHAYLEEVIKITIDMADALDNIKALKVAVGKSLLNMGFDQTEVDGMVEHVNKAQNKAIANEKDFNRILAGIRQKKRDHELAEEKDFNRILADVRQRALNAKIDAQKAAANEATATNAAELAKLRAANEAYNRDMYALQAMTLRAEEKALSDSITKRASLLRIAAGVAGMTGNYQAAAGAYGAANAVQFSGSGGIGRAVSAAGGALAIGATVGVAALGAGLAYSLVQGQEINKELAMMGTLITDAGLGTEKYSKSLEYARDIASELSTKYHIGMPDIIKGFKSALSSGIELNELKEFGDAANMLTVALGNDLEENTKLLTRFKDNFGLNVSQMKDVAGGLFQAINVGGASAKEIVTNVGRVLPIAAEARIEWTSLLNALGSTSRIMSGAQAVTGLNAAINSLVHPSKQAKEELTKLMGPDFREQIRVILSGPNGLEKMTEKLLSLGMDSESLGLIFSDKFANRSINALMTVHKQLNLNISAIKDFGKGAEAAAKANATLGENLYGTWIQVKNAIGEAGSALGSFINKYTYELGAKDTAKYGKSTNYRDVLRANSKEQQEINRKKAVDSLLTMVGIDEVPEGETYAMYRSKKEKARLDAEVEARGTSEQVAKIKAEQRRIEELEADLDAASKAKILDSKRKILGMEDAINHLIQDTKKNGYTQSAGQAILEAKAALEVAKEADGKEKVKIEKEKDNTIEKLEKDLLEKKEAIIKQDLRASVEAADKKTKLHEKSIKEFDAGLMRRKEATESAARQIEIIEQNYTAKYEEFARKRRDIDLKYAEQRKKLAQDVADAKESAQNAISSIDRQNRPGGASVSMSKEIFDSTLNQIDATAKIGDMAKLNQLVSRLNQEYDTLRNADISRGGNAGRWGGNGAMSLANLTGDRIDKAYDTAGRVGDKKLEEKHSRELLDVATKEKETTAKMNLELTNIKAATMKAGGDIVKASAEATTKTIAAINSMSDAVVKAVNGMGIGRGATKQSDTTSSDWSQFPGLDGINFTTPTIDKVDKSLNDVFSAPKVNGSSNVSGNSTSALDVKVAVNSDNQQLANVVKSAITGFYADQQIRGAANGTDRIPSSIYPVSQPQTMRRA